MNLTSISPKSPIVNDIKAGLRKGFDAYGNHLSFKNGGWFVTRSVVKSEQTIFRPEHLDGITETVPYAFDEGMAIYVSNEQPTTKLVFRNSTLQLGVGESITKEELVNYFYSDGNLRVGLEVAQSVGYEGYTMDLGNLSSSVEHVQRGIDTKSAGELYQKVLWNVVDFLTKKFDLN